MCDFIALYLSSIYLFWPIRPIYVQREGKNSPRLVRQRRSFASMKHGSGLVLGAGDDGGLRRGQVTGDASVLAFLGPKR